MFRKLGAPDPEGWARSQVSEGIPQLSRYLFLRQAWKKIVRPGEHDWTSAMRPKDPNAPGGELGPAIDRILATGAHIDDLTTVVRVMQWRLLSRLSVLIEDPGVLEDEVSDIWWQLFRVDENNKPIEPISGLIESVLETDPTGREMRPPSASG